MEEFDIAVLGSGPGGYPAAIRAAQLGKKVALIEEKELGGVCLNRGCIPSKVLIASSRLLHKIRHASEMGITIQGASFDWPKIIQRKEKIVSRLRTGLNKLILSNGIKIFEGKGEFLSPREIAVIGKKSEKIYAHRTVIATGSESREIAAFPCDHERVLDSTSIMEMKKLPKSLAIIGGGVIGSEFASLFQNFGVDVAIFEILDRIIPTESQETSLYLRKKFEERGILVNTQVQVEKIEKRENSLLIHFKNREPYEVEKVLVSVGRRINSAHIGLEKALVKVDEKGAIVVNSYLETSEPGIYAIGDATGKWWLAHFATHQGIVAAHNASGFPKKMNEEAVPSVIFTDPEIATVGLSAEKAKERGYQIEIGTFPFSALGKALAINAVDGFSEVIIDKKTGGILGARVIGEEAGTLIAEMTLAITNELTAESIEDTIHAHPTLSEVWLQSTLLALGTPIDFPRKKAMIKEEENVPRGTA